MTHRSNNSPQRVNLILCFLIIDLQARDSIKKVLGHAERTYSVGLILISFPFTDIPLISLFFVNFFS